MKPSGIYKFTAAIYSFSIAILVGYPSGAITQEPGNAPNMVLSLLIALVLGLGMTIYSARPKSPELLAANIFILPLIGISVFLTCLLINFETVSANAGFLFIFGFVALGLPFWPLITGFFLHIGPCSLSPGATPDIEDNQDQG